MKEVSDSQQRQQALDPETSFIIQAPAGSGKTELLIQRYLRMLSLVEAPEEIIAITFTRKAAAEMRQRILKAIEGAGRAEAAKNEKNEITTRLAEKVLEQNEKQGWQLLENVSRLRIQTIDSLTAALTRQMPVLSRFGAQPATLEKADELYQLAAETTLAELENGSGWSSAIATLLEHLDNNLPRVRGMLAGMLARRDQWMRHVARQEQRQVLEAALEYLVESKLKQVSSAIPSRFRQELTELLEYASGNLSAGDSASPLCDYSWSSGLPAAGIEDLETWRALAGFLLTREGKWRKRADQRLGFPAAGAGKSGADERAAMKARYQALLAQLAESAAEEQLREVSLLPQAQYSDNDWRLIDALYQLLMLADAQLRLLFAERNQMDFGGITQAAIDALGHEEMPSDLALQLDHRIRHILVDEFQDISINQYVLLQRLTAGWTENDQRSLFLVGDPMQSIYRFREAEVSLFLNTWQQQRLNQVALVPLNIRVNFRSQAGIVDWVNSVFARILPARADLSTGAVSYAEAEAFHDGTAEESVLVHTMNGRDDELEARRVAEIAAQARENDEQGSIAILVRSRHHLQRIIPALNARSLAYRAVDIEAMGQRPAIQDLLALSLAMTHFADRASWLAILRAPWCGLSLADLHHLVGDDKTISVWERLRDEERRQSLSEDGQQRLRSMVGILAPALQCQGRRRLRRWIESIWTSIGGPATLQSESDLKNAQVFFQLLDEFDDAGDLSDRHQFQQEVALLYTDPQVPDEQAVQIMTIHRAKGLEFDTVILPGLSRRGANDESALLLWMEMPHAQDNDLLLAPIKRVGETNSLIYDYLWRLEKEKQYFEQGRLLYVAATRAKRHLHVFASAERKAKAERFEVQKPARNSLAAHLWPILEPLFATTATEEEVTADTIGEETRTEVRNLRRLAGQWRLPPAPPPRQVGQEPLVEADMQGQSAIEFEWAGETIKHVGSVVHRCIQNLAEPGLENFSPAQIQSMSGFQGSLLTRLGVHEDELDDAIAQVQASLMNMFADDRAQWLFSTEHQQARNEYALSGVYRGKVEHVVIDRSFIDQQGRRWIVDYKTSRHEGGNLEGFLDLQQQRYRQQLEKYAYMMTRLDKRETKLALYFPLLQAWREWDYP